MIAAVLMAAAVVATPAQNIAKLAWMIGEWREIKDGVVTTEVWRAANPGAMAGGTQTNRPGQPETLEFEAIAAGAGKGPIVYTPFIKGIEYEHFTLKPGALGEAVFERESNDFPKRVIYRRCGDDLCARIEGVVNGKLQGKDWRYTRVAQ